MIDRMNYMPEDRYTIEEMRRVVDKLRESACWHIRNNGTINNTNMRKAVGDMRNLQENLGRNLFKRKQKTCSNVREEHVVMEVPVKVKVEVDVSLADSDDDTRALEEFRSELEEVFQKYFHEREGMRKPFCFRDYSTGKKWHMAPIDDIKVFNQYKDTLGESIRDFLGGKGKSDSFFFQDQSTDTVYRIKLINNAFDDGRSWVVTAVKPPRWK